MHACMVPENKLRSSFQGFIDSKLEDFRQKHGALTPKLIVESDGLQLMMGGSRFTPAFVVTMKNQKKET